MQLFRRIRQSLLSDQKFSKYLFYAVGEIILVVIGILIALYINDWNAEKNNEKVASQYVDRLIKELKQDVVTYERLKKRFAGKSESASALIENLHQNPVIVTDTAQFWSDFMNIIQGFPWYTEPVIWTQLVQSGELKYIKNQDAIEELFAHYSRVRSVGENYEQYPMTAIYEGRKLFADTYAASKVAIPEFNENILPPTELLPILIKNKDNLLPLIYRLGIISKAQSSSFDWLLESTQECIAILEGPVE